MKKINFFQKATLALTGLVAATFLSTALVSAIPYDDARTAASPVPAYNVFTGVPAPDGNESDFLRARVPVNGNDSDATTQYSDPLSTTCTPGQKIQMKVYVHNGASQDGNNGGTGPSVMHGATVKVAIPGNEATTFAPSATLSASNAATVTDGLTINCNGQKVGLKYIAGSASQYSKGSGVVALSDNIVTTGASIRSEQTPGDVYGCWDERVYVVLSVQVQAPTPPPPAPVVKATCDMFRIETADDRTIRVSQFKYTATNATFKNVVLNWDAGKTNDSSAAITDAAKVVGTTHKYNADGTYVVTATVYFSTAANPNLASSVENCTQQVTFKAKTPPVVTTTPEVPATPVTPVALARPTTLVNTGAGSMIAIFGLTSIVAAGSYRWMLGRRLV
ncbi:hypothetical protein H7Y63_02620 [Polaromonas sp.]|nr:hypothetical protein [Candidatus Saccharibacteria bacterium]